MWWGILWLASNTPGPDLASRAAPSLSLSSSTMEMKRRVSMARARVIGTWGVGKEPQKYVWQMLDYNNGGIF